MTHADRHVAQYRLAAADAALDDDLRARCRARADELEARR